MCTEKSIEELILNTKELDFAKSYHEKQMMIVDVVNNPEAGSAPDRYRSTIYDAHDVRFRFGTFVIEDTVCTIEEYNQCIEEMKCHYDIPKWCSYNRADKELLTVENSDQSFYKEKFVYGQVVYVNHGEGKDRLMKFGCFTLDSKKALLFDGDGYCRVTVESISSKPFKYKEDIELEEAKSRRISALVFKYGEENKGLFEDMLEGGHLAEIILPLEES